MVDRVQGELPQITRQDIEATLRGREYMDPQEAFKLWGEHIDVMSKVTGLPEEIIAGMMYSESSGNPMTSTVNPGDGNADIGLMQISNERWQGEVLPWALKNLTAEQQSALCESFGVDSLKNISLDSETLQNNPALSLLAGSLEAMMKFADSKVDGNVNKMLSYYNTGNPNAMPAEYLNNVERYAAQYVNLGYVDTEKP
jgi:hypothetical protein